MINFKSLELLHESKVVPEPIFRSIELMHQFVNSLITGNADWDEVKFVSDEVQAIYNAAYALYCEDFIKQYVWVIVRDSIKEFIDMFDRICNDNKVLSGNWEWTKCLL
ncbi:hypothetical protein SYYB1_2 [Bacillus phage vB_BaeroP_SYYB1]|uniref:Uncharacterized protein n=1 Tax=Bacillus phage vB_BaeroP_SYYB1 TaxID=2980552 RepID=A0A977SLY4_9CAUD|nr:hypothetical protein SYYB1_2 [Bacillus phage vB_BaeroP_SYYB1]